MNNKKILGALAMDLTRVALGYQRGSSKMVNIFFKEALKRREELDFKTLKPSIVKLLKNLESIKSKEKDKAAALAKKYSDIFLDAFQNFSS